MRKLNTSACNFSLNNKHSTLYQVQPGGLSITVTEGFSYDGLNLTEGVVTLPAAGSLPTLGAFTGTLTGLNFGYA